jgi:hypothetical protein
MCRCPYSHKSRDRAGLLTGTHVLSTVRRMSDTAEIAPQHAWTPCVVVDEEACLPRALARRDTAPVGLFVSQTLSRQYLIRHWFLDLCWLDRCCPVFWVLYPLFDTLYIHIYICTYIYTYTYICNVTLYTFYINAHINILALKVVPVYE